MISLLSSFTVEKALTSTQGYPTDHFFEDKGDTPYISRINKNFSKNFNLLLIFQILLIFPVFLISYVFISMGYDFIYVRKIDEFYKDKIKFRLRKMNHSSIFKNNETDGNLCWFKLLRYIVMIENNSVFTKMYNYLVIYGFLRSMTLIFSLFFGILY